MKVQKLSIVLLIVSILLSGCSNQSDETDLLQITEESSEKITLTYGYIDAYSFEDLDSTINEQIVSFNKSQDEYFIEIVKYGNDNYDEGLKSLNADISAGKGPDIIGISDEELLYQLGKKDVIADLYYYLDGETGIRREEFLDNILICFEQNGKLYGLTPLFKIWSLVGNPEYINSENITYWMLKAMLEEYADNGETMVCDGLTDLFVLEFCVLSSIDKFVDLDNYTCDFQNDIFRELLEFSMQYKSVDNIRIDTVESWARLQQDSLCIHYPGAIGNFQEYTIFRELTGEEGFSLIGFPALGGCTPQITTNFPYLTINSESEYKDVAWQFICTFFKDEVLTDNEIISLSKGLPVTKSGFERVDFVAEPGQFAIRGAIVDIFSFSCNAPYRISFFGDEIDSINIFDCNTQLSKEKVNEAEIYPDIVSAEDESFVSISDILPSDSMIWLDSSDMYRNKEFFSGFDRFRRVFMELLCHGRMRIL